MHDTANWRELTAIVQYSCSIPTGSCQCFDSVSCTGALVDASNERDCCVGTNNGLSFNDGGICTNCIGMYVTMCFGAKSAVLTRVALLSCSARVSTSSI